jgi:hypothetical protein
MNNGKLRCETLHREILERALRRRLEPDEVVDHIDGNGLNNCRNNLRPATRAQNRMNSKVSTNNASGYKGVSWHKRRGKWLAQIRIARKRIYLGYFASAEEAHVAYVAAAREHFGEFANDGNRPLAR